MNSSIKCANRKLEVRTSAAGKRPKNNNKISINPIPSSTPGTGIDSNCTNHRPNNCTPTSTKKAIKMRNTVTSDDFFYLSTKNQHRFRRILKLQFCHKFLRDRKSTRLNSSHVAISYA